LDNINIVTPGQSIALPIDKKKLGEFISGLLGQPQSISKAFEDSFSADHQWFIHFFSLIFQRIKQQNSAEPLSFNARILYKDKHERKVTTWQAFQHFSETQNIISVGAQFNLAFLIHFPEKQIPERQEINLIFNSEVRRQPAGLFGSLLGAPVPLGIIVVEVQHTERTWADDILRMIETEISNIQVVEPKYRIHLRKIFGPLFAFAFPIVMLLSMAYTQWQDENDGLKGQAQKLLEVTSTNLQVIHDKINILILASEKNALNRGGSLKIIFFGFIVTGLVYCVGLFLAQPNPSFVVLSRAAEKNRTEAIEKSKRRGLILLISTIASLALGIFGNFIYDSVK
jgi:hypothetical protein